MKNFLNKAEIKLDLSEKPKSVLSPEVEEAMEKLINSFKGTESIKVLWENYNKFHDFRRNVQNLLNALEKQFYNKLGEEK